MHTVFGSEWLFNSLLPLIMVWHCFCALFILGEMWWLGLNGPF